MICLLPILLFGFQTAVQIATEAVDRLVTTAASHNRVLVLEVMGRYAGWIAFTLPLLVVQKFV